MEPRRMWKIISRAEDQWEHSYSFFSEAAARATFLQFCERHWANPPAEQTTLELVEILAQESFSVPKGGDTA